jgi:hypothetical protein
MTVRLKLGFVDVLHSLYKTGGITCMQVQCNREKVHKHLTIAKKFSIPSDQLNQRRRRTGAGWTTLKTFCVGLPSAILEIRLGHSYINNHWIRLSQRRQPSLYYLFNSGV